MNGVKPLIPGHTDYELKSQVIAGGLLGEYKKIRKSFLADKYGWDCKNVYDVGTAYDTQSFFSAYATEAWIETQRVYASDRKRTKTLRQRIEEYLEKPCVFVTLTFRDDVLERTVEETRRRYVTRYLKSQSEHYVANLDYGGKKGREHYHAVVQGRVDPKAWEYGALNVKKVRNGTNDSLKLAKYVNKLTNHAIKDTCKRSAIIYSRDW